ncbi:hypothetical protein BDW69DRAFT_171651 [Aspergillus filifer]
MRSLLCTEDRCKLVLSPAVDTGADLECSASFSRSGGGAQLPASLPLGNGYSMLCTKKG